VSDARLKQRELASRWGYSERRVRAMIAEGRLSSFRLGVKLIRVSAKAVEEYECQSSASSPTEASSPPSTPRTERRHRQSLGTNDRLKWGKSAIALVDR
jgi:excisionase family DNA binding protein